MGPVVAELKHDAVKLAAEVRTPLFEIGRARWVNVSSAYSLWSNIMFRQLAVRTVRFRG